MGTTEVSNRHDQIFPKKAETHVETHNVSEEILTGDVA